jgi:hypothetical protein
MDKVGENARRAALISADQRNSPFSVELDLGRRWLDGSDHG